MPVRPKLWTILKWGLYFFLVLFAVAIEHQDDIASLIGGGECGKEMIKGGDFYQLFTTIGYRKPRPHYVKLVVLDPSVEPTEIFTNACIKREFVASIITKVRTANPSLIVLDFRYPAEYCNDSDEDKRRTAKLSDAIRDVLSSEIPIVVGEGSQVQRELELAHDPELTGLKDSGLSSTDLVLDPNPNFDSAKVTFGLIRLNCDTRRVPLFWLAYPHKSLVSKEKPEYEKSLAYQAARQIDTNLPTFLSDIIVRNEHPFTNFIPEDDFESIEAMKLLCGKDATKDSKWRQCSSADPQLPQLSDLKHKIVVVGTAENDRHESVLGEVPGYVLQANYIESLLDDRLFRPVRWYWEIALAVALIVSVSVIIELAPSFLTGAARAVGFVLVTWFASNLISVDRGLFLAFWIPAIPVLVVELLVSARERAEPHDEHPECSAEREDSAAVRKIGKW